MKFLCEQCKAKYQIADDKVAGKTVRMKCRKCGYLIEVRAEVTETSVAKELPTAPTATGVAPRPPRPAPPRAGPQTATALAASLTSARPASKPERLPASALAGGFRTSVQREEEVSAPFDMSELSPNEDWYVAINGVPVGPIQMTEIRRKAAIGAVTEDSLVWQEGLDEWRPLRAFPDLVAVVRSAVGSARTSLTPAPPEGRPSAVPPPRNTGRPTATASPAGYRGIPRATPLAGTPPPRSNVVALSPRVATAEKLDDAAHDEAVVAPAAVLFPGAAPVRAGSLAPDPFMPSANATQGAALFAAQAVAEPPATQRRAIPWIPITMVVMGGAFGITLAVENSKAPVVVQMPAPSAAAPVVVPAAATPQSADSPPLPVATVTAVPNNRPAAASPLAKASQPAAAAPGRSLDLHGIGQSNVALSEDPSGGDAPKVPGQCISEGQIVRVVQLHQVSLRRTCYERSQTTKPSVNVNVSLTVAADGSAQNVSASGDEPSVAKCIENDVRNWRFPAMGCSQKTAIPFKFVSQ